MHGYLARRFGDVKKISTPPADVFSNAFKDRSCALCLTACGADKMIESTCLNSSLTNIMALFDEMKAADISPDLHTFRVSSIAELYPVLSCLQLLVNVFGARKQLNKVYEVIEEVRAVCVVCLLVRYFRS
jgi:hypothetical protein